MSDKTEKSEHFDKNDEPKDDVEGHRLIEKQEVVEKPDVEGHMFEKAEKAEKAE